MSNTRQANTAQANTAQVMQPLQASIVKPLTIKNPPQFLFLIPSAPLLDLVLDAVFKMLPKNIVSSHTTAREISPHRTVNGMAYHSLPLSSTHQLGIIGPALGAPAAVLACEPFLASGTKDIILLGVGGGLPSSLWIPNIGNIVLPRGALSENGVVSLYGGAEVIDYQRCPVQGQLEAALNALPNCPPCFAGNVWSTDAPYRETTEKVERYASQQAILVEMEFAAVCQLATLYQANLAALFVVSDLLQEQWVSGFGSKELRRSIRICIEAILNTLSQPENLAEQLS